jgi:nicotinamidase-related amidase
VVEFTTAWHPQATAVIICDMWDKTWCVAAQSRVNELAERINQVVKELRRRGVFVIHAPSGGVTREYECQPARQRAWRAQFAKPPYALEQLYSPEAMRGEQNLPIESKADKCDCNPSCPWDTAPWERQIKSIWIDQDSDAITEDGREVWNLLTDRKIDNTIVCGVHLNRCVLGQPFGIRSLLRVGKTVALLRDLTDTLYHPNRDDQEPKGPPNHFDGTDLVIEHVEKYLCPTFVSSDILGGEPFRFRDDTRAAKLQ